MLDIKQAWDEVILRYHPDPEKRRELLANRLYVAMSTALAGSQEYMAMEKLHDLACRASDRPEVIVLDTPPSNHAVDFLEAPAKILDALDNDATRWLVEPFQQRGRITQRLFDAGSSLVLRALSRFTGAELLEELAALLLAFQAMFEGFKDRARAVRAVLEAEGTSFLVVGGATPEALAESRAFRERLVERRVRVGAMIANRAMPPVFSEARPPAPALFAEALRRAGGDDALRVRLEEVARGFQEEAQRHQDAVERLRSQVPACPVVVTPQLPRDIHDLAGLEALRRHLFAGAGDR
jgi:anion-transporting  ArsA/GET3 family ATPase